MATELPSCRYSLLYSLYSFILQASKHFWHLVNNTLTALPIPTLSLSLFHSLVSVLGTLPVFSWSQASNSHCCQSPVANKLECLIGKYANICSPLIKWVTAVSDWSASASVSPSSGIASGISIIPSHSHWLIHASVHGVLFALAV